MLNKKTYPMLNRAQRRHPVKDVSLMTKGWQAGGNWLLAALLERGGYNRKLARDDFNFGAQV